MTTLIGRNRLFSRAIRIVEPYRMLRLGYLTRWGIQGLAVIYFSSLFAGCRLLATKYNDMEYVVADSVANRVVVQQCIESIAHDFGFHTNITGATGDTLAAYELKNKRSFIRASIGEHFRLADGDILNLESLAAKLRQPASTDSVSQFLNAQLSRSPWTKSLLSEYAGGANKEFTKSLLIGLSFSGPFYEPKRFAGVSLSPETLELLNREGKVHGDSRTLNRMLLHDAYPHEIAKLTGTNHIMVLFGYLNTSGRKTKWGAEIENRLTNEFKRTFGPAVQITEHRGWIP